MRHSTGVMRETHGAASTAVYPALAARRRPAHIINIFAGAIYLACGNDVLAVVTSDAARLPNAVVLPATAQEHPFRGMASSSAASLGGGQIGIGPLRVGIASLWNPRPTIEPVHPRLLASRLTALHELITKAGTSGIAVPPGLLAACQNQDEERALPIIDSLIGLGPGLTPSGDDLLAGLLAALRLLGPDQAFASSCAARVTTLARHKTTALSAALLRLAADGQVCAEAADLLLAVAGQQPLYPAVRRLAGVGHTSGIDLATGILLGGIATAARSWPQPPWHAATRSSSSSLLISKLNLS